MPGKKQRNDKNGKGKQAQDKHGHDKPPLTEDEIKAIAERRAESLKRIQEQNAKNATKHFDDSKAGGRGPKGGGPPKARSFRHQGR
jgi:hypothetical protein